MLDALHGCDGTGGKATVVSPHHHRIDSVGTKYGNLQTLLERQQLLLVLQQYDAFTRHVKCQLLMGVTSHDALRDFSPGIQVVVIEVAQFETCYQQATQALVKVCLLDVATTYGLGQVFVFRTAFHIGACQNGFSRCLCSILRCVVPLG